MSVVLLLFHHYDARRAQGIYRVLRARGYDARGVEVENAAALQQLEKPALVLALLNPDSARHVSGALSLAKQSGHKVIPVVVRAFPTNRSWDKQNVVDVADGNLSPLLDRVTLEIDGPPPPAWKEILSYRWAARTALVLLTLVVVMLGIVLRASSLRPNVTRIALAITQVPTAAKEDTVQAGDKPDESVERVNRLSNTISEPPESSPQGIVPEAIDETEEADPTEGAFDDELLFADFVVAPFEGVAPLTVEIENVSEGNISEYLWDFDGDGIIDSTAANPGAYTYPLAGEFELSLTIVGVDGEEDSFTEYIFVESGGEAFALDSTPLADAALADDVDVFFVLDPFFGTAPLTVTFTNESDGTFTSYAWDFDGDGVIDSTEEYPQPYTYTQAGDYDISLTVTDENGNTFTATDAIIVDAWDGDGPEAFFSIQPDFGVAPLVVSFQNFSAGDITSYAWDFDGDGSIDSTEEIPESHVYHEPGDYRVSLRVSGPDGISEDTLTVTVDPVDAPYALFEVVPDFGVAPLTVFFTDLSEGDITSYAWDFDGDGVVDSPDPVPFPFTFEDPGEYPVSLTVTGPGGTHTDTLTVVVDGAEAPYADFDVSTDFGTTPLTVTFTNLSDGEISGYSWDFDGDGVVDSNAQNPPPYTYTVAGDYRVSLSVVGLGGSDSTDYYISVVEPELPPPPLALVRVSDDEGVAPFEVSVTNRSVGVITSFAWDFDGDGTVDSTDRDPAPFTYTTPGKYNLELVAAGPGGTDRTITTVDVHEPSALQVTFGADVTVGTVPFEVRFTNTTTDAFARYEWDFDGDGLADLTDTEVRTRTFRYTTPGIYDATLTGFDASGEGYSDTLRITAQGVPVLTATLADSLVDGDSSGDPTSYDTLQYTAVIRNTGTAVAQNVAYTATIPQHTAYLPGSTAIDGAPVNDRVDGRVVLPEALLPGESVTVTYSVTILFPLPLAVTPLQARGAVEASGVASVLTTDPDFPNTSSATLTSARRTLPALQATLVDSLVDNDASGGLTAGDRIDYVLTLTNNGDGPAYDAQFFITPPAFASFDEASALTDGAAAAEVAPGVVGLGRIDAGAQRTAVFSLTVDGPIPTDVTEIVVQAAIMARGDLALFSDDPATPAFGDATVLAVQLVVPTPETLTPVVTEETVTPVSTEPTEPTETPVPSETPVDETETPTAETETPITETETPIGENETPTAETETPIVETETATPEPSSTDVSSETPPPDDSETPPIETPTPETLTPVDTPETQTPLPTEPSETPVTVTALPVVTEAPTEPPPTDETQPPATTPPPPTAPTEPEEVTESATAGTVTVEEEDSPAESSSDDEDGADAVDEA